MHEFSITQQVLDITLNKAKEANATRVNQIFLVIGEMSSVKDDSIQFYFSYLSENTIAQGANLSFRKIPIKVKCLHCGGSFTPTNESWICPHCLHEGVEVIEGKEFYIESIEVD
jgi:hydrogenase nickel incorporation protein HypA/HybF